MLPITSLLLAPWVLIAGGFQQSKAQEAPFTKEVEALVALDSRTHPKLGQILFIGSSSFTKWTDVGQYFPGYPILNRAFGGSTLPDVIHFADKVVFPHKPKQVVIYCGENDFAADSKLPAYVVKDRFVYLFGLIRSKFPNVPIAYVSMKPSPSRWSMRSKFIAANHWIAEYCSQQKEARFIDVWDAMLGPDGRPKPDIFLSDNLHMNAKGYKIWKPIIEPALVR